MGNNCIDMLQGDLYKQIGKQIGVMLVLEVQIRQYYRLFAYQRKKLTNNVKIEILDLTLGEINEDLFDFDKLRSFIAKLNQNRIKMGLF